MNGLSSSSHGRQIEIDTPAESEKVAIVLIDPKYDGNIGAVARTILNFGIKELRVVGRDGNWSDEARNRQTRSANIEKLHAF